MFCPKCASQNVEGASFCRACGANISLVPQALKGTLPVEPADRFDRYEFRRRHRGESSDYAARALMMGVAFAAMAVLTGRFSPGAGKWWFWLLIPAMIFFSRGFSALVRMKARRSQTASLAPEQPQPQLNSVRASELPVPRTGELRQPVPSVTEGTTRHLGTDAQTRHLDQPS